MKKKDVLKINTNSKFNPFVGFTLTVDKKSKLPVKILMISNF